MINRRNFLQLSVLLFLPEGEFKNFNNRSIHCIQFEAIINESKIAFNGINTLNESICLFNPFVYSYLEELEVRKIIQTFIFWQGNDFENYTSYLVCVKKDDTWNLIEIKCFTSGQIFWNQFDLYDREQVETYIKKITARDNRKA